MLPDGFRLERALPELNDPLLVIALTGWIDASNASAEALDALHEACAVEPLATFDGDTYLDYRARRPTMELRAGVNTRLVWPEIRLGVGRTGDGRDLVTLSGPEPDTQWRRFCREVTGLATQLGVVRAIGFGAYPFSTPHTRPPRLSCTSPSAETFAGLPFLFSSLDVPAGTMAALEHTLHDAGIPALGIWVQVPHYIATMPDPLASSALIDALESITGVSVDHDDLRHAGHAQRAKVAELVAANPEHAAMVAQLEQAYDHFDADAPSDAPDPTGLAAEVERYLRGQVEGD